MDFKLGYVCLEVSDLAAFDGFLTDIAGFARGESSGEWSAYRLDGAAARLFCRQGPFNDIVATGWDMNDKATLESTAKRLEAAGAVVGGDDTRLAQLRKVKTVMATRDFHGTGVELFIGQEQSGSVDLPLVEGGFLADDRLGLGHVVLVSRDKSADLAFYRDGLGLRWSDDIVMPLGSFGNLDATFLHANPRHHSLAVGSLPEPLPLTARLDHICFEMCQIDDVGMAHSRFVAAGLPIVRDFGMHPNDRAFSFYGKTPAGFDFEMAHGSALIDEVTWKPTTYDRITRWGHRSEASLQSFGD
jgi:2,3-dihydroxybiphenyl 1,2-dioxygenase